MKTAQTKAPSSRMLSALSQTNVLSLDSVPNAGTPVNPQRVYRQVFLWVAQELADMPPAPDLYLYETVFKSALEMCEVAA